ncbi:MAG: 4Fe-4S binding protein [Christensenellaceae bacterium]|jgi:Fe-S-cluster-containing hydrogenase component 2|nr:4Fe-4S binding protein [Christensenellaceae bacterium]
MSYIIDQDKCITCGACAGACPVDAVENTESKYAINADVCIDCGSCAGECPCEAISG